MSGSPRNLNLFGCELYKSTETTGKLWSQPRGLDAMKEPLSAHPPGDDSLAVRPKMNARVGRPILVVDDHDDVRIALAELLRQEGFSVVEACDGKEALDYILTAPTIPSLVLLDLNMPVMSGWEVIRGLQGQLRFAHLPIILVTGERTPTDPASREIVGRLSKPFLPDEMLALVRRYVVGPTAERISSPAVAE